MWVETQIQKLYYLCLVAFSTPTLKLDKSKKMASIVPHSVADDRDLDDADLWAVIDSTSKSCKSLVIRSPNFQSLSPISNPSPPSKLSKYPKTPNSNHSDTTSRVLTQGEVIQEPWVYRLPRKVVRTCASEASETSPFIVLKNMQCTPTTLVYSLPEAHLLLKIGKFNVKELSPCSESYGWSEEKHMVHSGLELEEVVAPLELLLQVRVHWDEHEYSNGFHKF